MKRIYQDPYSKGKTNNVHDWAKALNTPYEDITEEYLNSLTQAAGSWSICACANLCSSIPRNEIGQPKDFNLQYLGERFSEEVDEMVNQWWENNEDNFELHRQEALYIHKEIELRATEILKEMGIIK